MIEKLTGIIDGLNGWEVITNNRKPLRDKLNEIIDVVNRLEEIVLDYGFTDCAANKFRNVILNKKEDS